MKKIDKNKFLFDSEKIVFDLKHRKTINFNIGKYQNAFLIGCKRYLNLEESKIGASNVKQHVISKLPYYLEIFEAKAKLNGIEVLWAVDNVEAIKLIDEIIVDEKIKTVVKSKTITSEEILFNEIFEKRGIECVETDLGEFIVQSAGEKPYHILTPAMHKSRSDVAILFNKLYGIPIDSTASEITSMARSLLRDKFENADMGLTGANFLLANEGAISITENEGNALFSISYPRIHLVIAGIEKILPSVDYLDQFLHILALHGTGQRLTSYNSIISGSLKDDNLTSKRRVIVILLDNGRSRLYGMPLQSIALTCIRCGACLNSCPVYKNIGGHAYNTVYSGPIGSVIMPFLQTGRKNWHLSFASSLCGACYEVCPMKIDLPGLLLLNRKKAVEEGYYSKREKMINYLLYKILQRPVIINRIGTTVKSFIFSRALKNPLGKRRSPPGIKEKSFQKQYLDHVKLKK